MPTQVTPPTNLLPNKGFIQSIVTAHKVVSAIIVLLLGLISIATFFGIPKYADIFGNRTNISIISPKSREEVEYQIQANGTFENILENQTMLFYVYAPSYNQGKGKYFFDRIVNIERKESHKNEGTWEIHKDVYVGGDRDKGGEFRVGVILTDEMSARKYLENVDGFGGIIDDKLKYGEITVIRR